MFETYQKINRVRFTQIAYFEGMRHISSKTFNYPFESAAVFSSKIEGEQIEMDSFLKHKRLGVKYQPDYTRKIDDLYDAYVFAQQHAMTKENIAAAHAMLTKHILQEPQQGTLRTGNMYVITNDGKIEYVAATPDILVNEMAKLYQDLETLLAAPLTMEEVFFFAAMIHLVFVKIHPYEDGNGRTARLLEKWFLARHLGEKAWYIQSEKNYYEKHQQYYATIRRLGLEYDTLDYSNALPFLQLLPGAISDSTG